MSVQLANVNTTIRFLAVRVGTGYDYGGMLSPTNTKVGTDCSGLADTALKMLTTGNGGPTNSAGRFLRTLSTESWPYNYGTDLAMVGARGPYGTVCVGDAQPGPPPTVFPPHIPADAAAIIYLMHGGGGEDSHVMLAINDGAGNHVVFECGGAHNDISGSGRYQSPNGPVTPTNSPEWTDIWVLEGPVVSATPTPTPTPVFAYPSDHQMLVDIWEQQRGPQGKGWPQLGKNAKGENLTPVDAIAALKAEVEALKSK
jgi:hypothetical protein